VVLENDGSTEKEGYVLKNTARNFQDTTNAISMHVMREMFTDVINSGYQVLVCLGVTQDYISAVSWYSKGAEAGNATAMGNLGWMYENGYGVAKSYNEAVYWYRKVASLGNEYAKKNLTRLGEKF
jgi:TPR repeat protein